MGKGDSFAISKEDRRLLQIHCDEALQLRFDEAKRVWAGKPEQKGNPIRQMEFMNHLLNLENNFNNAVELISKKLALKKKGD